MSNTGRANERSAPATPAAGGPPPLGRARRVAQFWLKGEPFVWATGAALACTLTMTAVLLGVVLWNGLGVFWPSPLQAVVLKDGNRLLGDVNDVQYDPHTGITNIKFRVGNSELQQPFRWVAADEIVSVEYPPDALMLDRMRDLQYIGYLKSIEAPGLELAQADDPFTALAAALTAVRARRDAELSELMAEEKRAAQELHRRVKYQLIRARFQYRQLSPEDREGSRRGGALAERIAELERRETELKSTTDRLRSQINARMQELRRNVGVFVDASGRESRLALLDIVRFSHPNSMTFWAKVRHYAAKVWELVSDDPREANQDGGIFPAIFGTVLMVFLMAIACFPLGVLAGIYLGEYAKSGPLVNLVRVAVNNLAGIPSIVFGIFGLGFFVYFVGGHLDAWFYPDRVAAAEPVFGKSSILWASLTLGLLTVPVVIVSTEEALRAIPRSIPEGAYALGSTKFQALWRVLMPMASPGVMTGFILAMARAAGEVAPLMLTGAVKDAPLPLDSQFPFIQFDQKFMHLGYHILDISCKSPNVEATKPLVYATTLLLLLIVLGMSGAAIWLRNRMRARYQSRAM